MKKSEIEKLKIALMQKFTMKDLGEIKNYIGIDVEYKKSENKMNLSQTEYIESLAEKYYITDSNLFDTSMETNLKVDQAQMTDESIKYRNLIGELSYISSGTRPDVSYSVNYLSRYQNGYDITHYKHALRILKYLYKTKDVKLRYGKFEGSEKLDCFVDADYAGDHIDRKSTSGYLIRMYGNVIYWKSKKQNVVTKCSTFAEYIALSEAVTEIQFMRNLFNEMFDNINQPVKIYEDNSGAVGIGKCGNFTKKFKAY